MFIWLWCKIWSIQGSFVPSKLEEETKPYVSIYFDKYWYQKPFRSTNRGHFCIKEDTHFLYVASHPLIFGDENTFAEVKKSYLHFDRIKMNGEILTEADMENLRRRMAEARLKGVTEEEIHGYYEAFHEFDRDASGNISTSELGQVMRSLGENPTGMELEVEESSSHNQSHILCQAHRPINCIILLL